MSIFATRTSLRGLRLAVPLFAIALAFSACSDDDAPPPASTPTSTSTPQPTSTSTAKPSSTSTPEAPSTPTATETPTPPPHEHDEITFGSNELGAGTLVMEFDGDHQHLDFDTCLGGEGDDCVGGIAVYSSDAPGYEHTGTNDPEVPIYKLDDGTSVSVVVVAIDEGLSLNKDGATADAPGESLALGTVPELEHTHVDYIATVPGGTTGWEKSVTVKLVTTNGDYAESEPVTIEFKAAHE